jgi:hypothetical protein
LTRQKLNGDYPVHAPALADGAPGWLALAGSQIDGRKPHQNASFLKSNTCLEVFNVRHSIRNRHLGETCSDGVL